MEVPGGHAPGAVTGPDAVSGASVSTGPSAEQQRGLEAQHETR